MKKEMNKIKSKKFSSVENQVKDSIKDIKKGKVRRVA